MEKILVVEDDLDINKLLEKILLKEGYEVVTAFSGTEGQLRLSMDNFDLMLCDLMLPGLSGEDLIRGVRAKYIFPIIALTAKGGLDDKVTVLELGADDYMTKPFETRELLARVRAQLRRIKQMRNKNEDHTGNEQYKLVFRDMELIPESLTVSLKGQPLELTGHEFAILQIMMEAPKRVYSKESLYESVWKNGYYGEDNTISVHISNIRKKIAKITTDEYISTVWGIGYKLNL
ncbi:MAG: response regulator transcription factor [Lachnospiraceae bacterium]